MQVFKAMYNMPQAPFKKLRCESKKDCNQKIAMNINEMLIVASRFHESRLDFLGWLTFTSNWRIRYAIMALDKEF